MLINPFVVKIVSQALYTTCRPTCLLVAVNFEGNWLAFIYVTKLLVLAAPGVYILLLSSSRFSQIKQ